MRPFAPTRFHPLPRLPGLHARRRRRAAALTALVLSVAVGGACRSAVGPADLLLSVGTYDLRAVNASPLPTTADGTTISGGTLEIKTNGQYFLTEKDAAGNASFTSSGQWQAPQGTVQFKDATTGKLYLGALSASADSMNVTVGTHLDLFVRQ